MPRVLALAGGQLTGIPPDALLLLYAPWQTGLMVFYLVVLATGSIVAREYGVASGDQCWFSHANPPLRRLGGGGREPGQSDRSGTGCRSIKRPLIQRSLGSSPKQ